MTRQPVEDWVKTRAPGADHLTESERAFIDEKLAAGWTARAIARELKCSTRSINRHKAIGPMVRDAKKHKKYNTKGPRPAHKASSVKKPAVPRPDRFYRSNFEPT